MGLNTTPRTWTTGELVSAALMNTEVRDALTGIQAAWTSYTPAWTSNGTAPALGNGTLTGAYLQIGKTVFWRFKFTAGSTTTYGTGAYFISLPVTPVNPQAIGQGVVTDTGVNSYAFVAQYIGDAGGTRLLSTTSPGVVWAQTSPFTFGNTDTCTAGGTYEVP